MRRRVMLSEGLRHFLLIYMLVSFLSYWFYVVKTIGIQESISDSYYYVSHPFLFIVFIANVAIPIFILGSQGYPILIVAGMFLAFVGGAAKFREKLTDEVHVAGAMGGIALGYVALIVEFHQILTPAIMAVVTAILSLTHARNHTWWIETVAFIGVIIPMFTIFW